MKVVAILACHNRRELSLQALRLFFAQDIQATLSAVVVDDGSVDGTADAIRSEFPDATVVPGTGHMYWAAAMALAERTARATPVDVLLWLNDDVTLDPGALRLMSATSILTTPPSVVAGALLDDHGGAVSYAGYSVSRWHPLRMTMIQPNGAPRPIDTFNGNVVWVPREALDAAGGIDGRFAHAYADNDFGLRLRARHYPVVLAPEPVGHCSRATSSRSRRNEPSSLKQRWAALNAPSGLPIRSQVRYMRRHGPPAVWPFFALAPYARALLPGARWRRERQSPRRGPSSWTRTRNLDGT